MVSISLTAARTRASEWASDMPVGAITGRGGFQRVPQARRRHRGWMHGSFLEHSPRRKRQEAGVRLRGTGETELPSPELSGWSGDAVFV
jgi:hypothetical protein